MAAAMHAAIDHIDGALGLWPVFDLVAETLSVREIVEVIKMLFGVEIGMEHQNVWRPTHGGLGLQQVGLVPGEDCPRVELSTDAVPAEFARLPQSMASHDGVPKQAPSCSYLAETS